MTNIINLVPLSATVQEDVVRMLEHFLKEAREGRYKMAAVIGITQAGDAVHQISAGPEALQMLGAFSRIAWTLNQEIDASNVHTEAPDDD